MSLLSSLVPAFNHATPAKATDAGGPFVKPAYEIQETADAFGVTVHLPGVAKDGLEITADAETITLTGRRQWKRPEAWTQLYRETSDSAFRLELTHDNVVDIDKIHAELIDGILRVSLPKAEAIKPRRITVA